MGPPAAVQKPKLKLKDIDKDVRRRSSSAASMTSVTEEDQDDFDAAGGVRTTTHYSIVATSIIHPWYSHPSFSPSQACKDALEQMQKGPLSVDNFHMGRPSNVNGRPRQSTMHQVRFSLHAGSGGTRAVEGFGPSAQIRENMKESEQRKKRPSEEFQAEDLQAAKRRTLTPSEDEVATNQQHRTQHPLLFVRYISMRSRFQDFFLFFAGS